MKKKFLPLLLAVAMALLLLPAGMVTARADEYAKTLSDLQNDLSLRGDIILIRDYTADSAEDYGLDNGIAVPNTVSSLDLNGRTQRVSGGDSSPPWHFPVIESYHSGLHLFPRTDTVSAWEGVPLTRSLKESPSFPYIRGCLRRVCLYSLKRYPVKSCLLPKFHTRSTAGCSPESLRLNNPGRASEYPLH